QWAQVYRQAALLADLLAEPLEDVLRHAAGVREAEWRADFRRRYQGRAVVFDTDVRRTADGYRLGYVLRAGDEEAHLDVGGLTVLRGLPLDQPQRLLFGVRLAAVGREAPGGWVVRFEPDSGVLLTDAAAAAACCPVLADSEGRALIDRQGG